MLLNISGNCDEVILIIEILELMRFNIVLKNKVKIIKKYRKLEEKVKKYRIINKNSESRRMKGSAL
ncbi:hypothetical protein OW763_07500 [Clostridium aestuarii]|uniref:Uncharacterized protein n=1 Tax=Clostridium aestuarii TaxID=338193 RepID=A0ABT4CYZ0_9CLOT|nr:hypothetical protein [Clostridium aestuarii]MCY6484199.1 hypothetical protein [Clostridium aestuarii]